MKGYPRELEPSCREGLTLTNLVEGPTFRAHLTLMNLNYTLSSSLRPFQISADI